MDIRIMGTKEECEAFAAMVRETVPAKNIRQISHWYANHRKGEFSTEGRIYISFRDTVIFPNTLPEAKDPEEKKTEPEIGTCAYCGKEHVALMILSWDVDQYRGACTECAKRYVDQQTIGMLLQVEDPELYAELWKKAHPVFRGIYHGPSGYQEIWTPADHCPEESQ